MAKPMNDGARERKAHAGAVLVTELVLGAEYDTVARALHDAALVDEQCSVGTARTEALPVRTWTECGAAPVWSTFGHDAHEGYEMLRGAPVGTVHPQVPTERYRALVREAKAEAYTAAQDAAWAKQREHAAGPGPASYKQHRNAKRAAARARKGA